MRATVRQIQTFLLIHREGSFAAASRLMGISQVAVSKQMAALERALGGEVFERRMGARITLNTRGQLFLNRAPEYLNHARQLDQEMRRDTSSLETVRVAADGVLIDTIFHRATSGFYATHRDIQIEFVECEPALESITDMAAKRIDLAYLTLASHIRPAPGELLATTPAGLFISPNFPGASTWRNDSPEPLPMIFPLAGSKLELSMMKSLAKLGVSNYRVAAHVQFGDLMRDLAIQGLGAVLLAKPRAAAALESGQLIQLTQVSAGHSVCRYVIRNPLKHSPQTAQVERYLSSLVRERAQTWQ